MLQCISVLTAFCKWKVYKFSNYLPNNKYLPIYIFMTLLEVWQRRADTQVDRWQCSTYLFIMLYYRYWYDDKRRIEGESTLAIGSAYKTYILQNDTFLVSFLK